MRHRAALLFAVLALACTRVPKLSAVEGNRGAANVESAGVDVRAIGNAWKGYPSWFTRRYTPVWVSLLNRGNQAYDVTYQTLSLADEQGQVFPAVPPLLAARDAMQAQPLFPSFDLAQAHAPTPDEQAIAPPPPLPPSSPPAPPTPGNPSGSRGTIFFNLPAYGYSWEPIPDRGLEGNTPFGYQPPFWGPFGPQSYGRDAADIVQPALHEGRLLPNTHAEGFVYFRADLSAQRITFRILAPSEIEGGPPLDVRILFSAR